MMRLSSASHIPARFDALGSASARSIILSTCGFAYSAMLLFAAGRIDFEWNNGRKNERAPSPG
jgi:hypothetical protein